MEQLPASMLQHLSNACERAFADPFSGNPGSGGFLAAAGFVDAFRRRRILHELVHGTARPRNELTPAVGAHAAQDFARARAAEGALEGTNESLGGVGREIAVAALAVRAELQHFMYPSLSRSAAPLCQTAAPGALERDQSSGRSLVRVLRSEPFRRVVRRKGAVGQELDLRALDELGF